MDKRLPANCRRCPVSENDVHYLFLVRNMFLREAGLFLIVPAILIVARFGISPGCQVPRPPDPRIGKPVQPIAGSGGYGGSSGL